MRKFDHNFHSVLTSLNFGNHPSTIYFHQFLVVLLDVLSNEVFPSKIFGLRFVEKHDHIKEAKFPKRKQL